MQRKFVRTDLALDAHEKHSQALGDISGAALKKFDIRGFTVTELNISSPDASNLLCKPIGNYYTIEIKKFIERRENSFTDAAETVAELLRRFEAVANAGSFLIACLGNEKITPDAIGPITADSLIVTRHLISSAPETFASFSSVAVLRTGVLGTSGIESADSLKAICREIKPDCVIAVDALASWELERLCKTVQLCDSGISPGSGVGNNRAQLNSETLGIPVIAMGVPTVIDAAAFTDEESATGLFVTPRNIDELVSSVSRLIAYGINIALHDGLTVSDIDLLVE
ncbi:MAG: GPR endopeptidase [Bacillota bacterium]|nr:GPR endopeptidase [Bacillota bacterium]